MNSFLTRPGELMADVAAHVQDPDPRALGVTLLMAALFGVAYLMLFALTSLGGTPLPDPLPAKRGEGI